ncbi:hypothetical protein C2S53_001806 [Perilla frutescens var. hirtella]|uniref:Uncharacterized protein n=1 Tax=Perilla frutescens var. hirtella TaxID=608512 RepID=A0AAD4IPX8_PERFH|nr:hypothetical protein C2S53_001806 [Perilla frutescens var. hirtella]
MTANSSITTALISLSQSPGRLDLRRSGGGQAISDGSSERLRGLLEGGRSQARHGGSAQLHPRDRKASGRTKTGRHHVKVQYVRCCWSSVYK